MQKNLILLFLAAALVVIGARYLGEQEAVAPAEPVAPAPALVQPAAPPALPAEDPAADQEGEEKLLFDISLHTEEELLTLLHRVEELTEQPRGGEQDAEIALVLHGPEVAFFTVQNYPRYKEVVDLAAKLAAFNAIQVRMCQTMMRSLDIQPEDVPAFIEQVPFGPAEVDRLLDEGYVRM